MRLDLYKTSGRSSVSAQYFGAYATVIFVACVVVVLVGGPRCWRDCLVEKLCPQNI